MDHEIMNAGEFSRIRDLHGPEMAERVAAAIRESAKSLPDRGRNVQWTVSISRGGDITVSAQL